MAEGFNSKCETLKRKLVNDINNSQLPIGAVYFIYKSLYQEIENTYYGSLNDEAQDIPVNKKNDEVLEEAMGDND